ncbi:P-loop containing nucleoside triphosphate hydrolase protein [Trametes coccinea BRFM310]|uniref:p-loop containing nucleoside triphosphate hydrolase protein n=1 Tax=Trametes coccinea (strain BRFM310) TaxID=1353009 RepID=A0A1Y2IDR3_TRAC3|nr:P-loop containing nucleoside triphosphate hydrolase protein [Trametes coccinea BRFM310]
MVCAPFLPPQSPVLRPMSATISQHIIPHVFGIPSTIRVHRLTRGNWAVVDQRMYDEDASVCGVSLRISREYGDLDAVAFATPTDVFVITLTDTGPSPNASQDGNPLLHILDGSRCLLAGFGMARIALHLYRQWTIHVEGVDLASLFHIKDSKLQTPADFASRRIDPDVDTHKIHALWYGDSIEDLCLRAWLSAVLAEDSSKEVSLALKIRTSHLEDSHLQCLSRLLLNVELLEAERPTLMDNEFDGVDVGADGQLTIRNARFNTRVRRSKQTSIIMETEHGHSIIGHAVRADGKKTGVKVTGGNFRGDIARIRVVGREELTNSEIARDEFLLRLLQGVVPSLVESQFNRMLWFPAERVQGKAKTSSPVRLRIVNPNGKLNDSQAQVVAAMRSLEEPLVIVHGPPGTGKTSTIAAALHLWEQEYSPAWVIAQSNVGVKNIARTLIKRDIDFKLIVSKEFYVEWHEHLYEEIEERLIRSDELFSDPVDAERKIGGSMVILCTIAMLSNPAIDNCGIFRLVPVERLVVDEASQIDTFEFMHLFHKFRDLQKVCMFGDPKQLPPYGKETAPGIKTIYDFKHLKASAYFLNTQYRMPLLLGEFISDHVYDSKLRSVHAISDRSAVRFVNVRKGTEERVGSSWKVC